MSDGKDDEPTADDSLDVTFNAWKLAYGIGSGAIRTQSGADGERVAAAMLLEGITSNAEMRAVFDADGGLDVDDLLDACRELVASGMITDKMANKPMWEPGTN